MPGIQDLIRTIVELQGVRAQQDAQQLARERFGLETQTSKEQMLASVLSTLPNFQDPNKFISQNAPELSNITGASQDLLASAAAQTPPSIPTQRAGTAARGAATVGSALDVPTAYSSIAGALPGSVSEDTLMSDIFTGAHGTLTNMPPDQKNTFMQQVLSKVGPGMSLGAAAIDQAVAGLGPDERAQAARIGKGLAPSASDVIQTRLGYANLREQNHFHQMSAALDELRLRGELDAHKATLGAQAFKEADDLVKERSQFIVDAAKNGSTLTDQGLETYRAQVNAYNNQLRKIAPEVYGPTGTNPLEDLKPGETISTSVLQQFMKGPKFP